MYVVFVIIAVFMYQMSLCVQAEDFVGSEIRDDIVIKEKVYEEDTYAKRFIAKYVDGQYENEKVIIDKSKEAFQCAKKEKEEQKKIWKGKQGSAAMQEANAYLSELEEDISREASDVEIDKCIRDGNVYEIIKLNEHVPVSVFVEQFLLENTGKIEYVQPDYEVELAAERRSMELEIESFNETEFAGNEVQLKKYTEGICEEGRTNSFLNREEDLREAWRISKGAGITIALIDTGIDVTHPDLVGHVTEMYDFQNDCRLEYQPEMAADFLHGTHIAGILASSAPEAQIMPLKVFENGKAYTSDIIKAIIYAKEKGANIVNMSFGSTDDNQALRETMENSELFFVCAAGNNRLNIDETPIYPAAFGLNNSISVTAFNQDFGLSYFSNYGEKNVDIAAWGRDVVSTMPGGGYRKMNGTSMSAGYVSAAAAMVASSNGTENLKEILKASAQKLSCLEGKIDCGNKISFSSAVGGIESSEIVHVTPEDDFDIWECDETPEKTWMLFEKENNLAVAVGQHHSLVVKADGSVWAWGDNYQGQIGDGTKNHAYHPVKVIGLTNIKAVAAGTDQSFAIGVDGTVWAWGYNGGGKLGDGTQITRTLPVKITALPENSVKSISTGWGHTLAVMEDGTVWSWGNGQNGVLGDGTMESKKYPVQLLGLHDIKEVSAGFFSSLALQSNGDVWGWGKDLPGHVADGKYSNVPIKLESLSNITSLSTGLGRSHAGVDKEGRIWAWGEGFFGMGKASEIREIPELTGVSTENPLTSIKAVSFGGSHAVALKNDGTVWIWGENKLGQLGNGSRESEFMAKQVAGVWDMQFVGAGQEFTIALRKDRTIWGWGQNYAGQLGLETGCNIYENPIQLASNTIFSNARLMEFEKTLQGSIEESAESRFYRFNPQKTADYLIHSPEGSNGICVYLYDSDRKLLASDMDIINGKQFSIVHRMEADEAYYLEVRGITMTAICEYSIRVNYWDDCGNTVAGAVMTEDIGILDYAINYPGDVDIIQFTPKIPGNYTFQISGDSDIYAYLYDSLWNLLSDNNDLGGSEGQKYKVIVGNTYYIQVKAASSDKIGDYHLKIKYADDYVNVFEGAYDISQNYITLGEMDYYGDVDMFMFIPQTTQTYIFTTESSTQMSGYLYDQRQEEIKPNESDKRVQFESLMIKGETYYLQIGKEEEKNVGSYKLYIETPLTVTIE